MRSPQREDYLTAIYRQQRRAGKASTSDVARALGVTPASTTSMFKRLASDGLIDYKEYGGASLAPDGELAAAGLIRRHRLTERFLADVLGFPWDQVHRLADEMEHALPDEVIDRLAEVLGEPTTCPHGFPIPLADGTLPADATHPLAESAQGDLVEIHRVAEDDAELLRYLSSVRLVPGQLVRVLTANPIDETMRLAVGDREVIVGPRVAWAVSVQLVTES